MFVQYQYLQFSLDCLFSFFQLFGADDPFFGLSYNPVDDRSKPSNSGELNFITYVACNTNAPCTDWLSDVLEESNDMINMSA